MKPYVKKYTRWKSAIKDGHLLAICKLCHRVETDRRNLAFCPRGCHNEEMKQRTYEGGERAKKAAKQEGLPWD